MYGYSSMPGLEEVQETFEDAKRHPIKHGLKVVKVWEVLPQSGGSGSSQEAEAQTQAEKRVQVAFVRFDASVYDTVNKDESIEGTGKPEDVSISNGNGNGNGNGNDERKTSHRIKRFAADVSVLAPGAVAERGVLGYYVPTNLQSVLRLRKKRRKVSNLQSSSELERASTEGEPAGSIQYEHKRDYISISTAQPSVNESFFLLVSDKKSTATYAQVHTRMNLRCSSGASSHSKLMVCIESENNNSAS